MKKPFREFYVPVYKKLLEVPQYVKYFDSKSIGAAYRLIASRIWRLDKIETEEAGYFSEPFLSLADYYERGYLAAHISDTELADLVGVSQSYARKIRANLQNLGIAKITKAAKNGNGYFYVLGQLAKQDEYGTYLEYLYIDSWLKQVDDWRRNDVFPKFIELMEKYLNGAGKEKNLTASDSTESRSDSTESEIGTENVAREDDKEGKNQSTFSLPYKDNNYNSKDSKITGKTKEPVLAPLFGELENSPVSLMDILGNLNFSPVQLKKRILEAIAVHGKDKTISYLSKILNSDVTAKRLKLTNLFTNWYKKFRPENKFSVLVWVWWAMYALDTNTPEIAHISGKNLSERRVSMQKIYASVNSMPITEFDEFLYVIDSVTKNNGEVKLLGLKNISWLTNLVKQHNDLVLQFREAKNNISNALTSRSMVELRQRIQQEEERQREELYKGISKAELDSIDIDEFLS